METKNKYNGFKLISLELKHDKIFGDIKYDFIEDHDKQNEIYTTVLIGPNGTRKSMLFRRIITLFWDIYTLREEPKKTFKYNYWFTMVYSMDNLVYEYSNIHQFGPNGEIEGVNYLKIHEIEQKNEKGEYTFKDAVIPDTIVANTVMITDKFLFPVKDKFQQYQYLGPRYRPQLASTSSYISRAVDFIAKGMDNKAFLKGITSVISEFFSDEFVPCSIFYTLNSKLFFSGILTPDKLIRFFEDMDIKYSKKTTKPPFKLGYYKKNIRGNDELILNLVTYCNKLKDDLRLRGIPKSSKKAITFKLNTEADLELLNKEIKILNELKSLGIVYSPVIEFLKGNDKDAIGYSILESSSGEHNLFGTMIGLMATIKPCSLIFIDEPEISLHPNWQMKYLNFLRVLFENPLYSKAHILVATHSHFIISDLKGDNSKIIGLTRNPSLSVLPLPENVSTFGWTPDEVLYRIFGLRTSRNHYFEYDITQLANLIQNESRDLEKIRKSIDSLKKYKFSANDPLNYLIEKGEQLLQK